MVGDKPTQWDLVLPFAEFAYNNSKNRSTQPTPFEVVYRLTPNSVKADEFAQHIKNTLEQIKTHIEANNAKHKLGADIHRREVVFQEDDFVWAFLTKDKILTGVNVKSHDRKVGPCKIIRKINDNAYQLQLPSHLNTSDAFNVKHLFPFKGDLHSIYNSRTSFLQSGTTDAANQEASRNNHI